MCIDMYVNLPAIATFLLLYSLRSGCFVAFLWTLMRSFFSLFFFIVVLLEALVKRKSPFGQVFVHSKEPTTEANIFHLYYCSIVMIIAESFLLVFCYYLLIALITERSEPIARYLNCRFITWLIEIINLVVLTVVHRLLIGWYLGMLMIVILEFYLFVVVYSYYTELLECRKPCF